MLCVLAIFLAVLPVGATSISDLQKQQQELRRQREEERRQRDREQRKLDELSQELLELTDSAGMIYNEIEGLDADLVVIIASVDMIGQDIAEKEADILITAEQHAAAKAAEEEQYEAMKRRLKHMYESSEASSYVQILVDSSSLSDMLTRFEYMEKLNDYDQVQLDNYIKIKEETQALWNLLLDERAILAAWQIEMEQEKAAMEALMAEKQAIYADYEVMIAKARQQAAVYGNSVRTINDEIRRLERAEADARAKEVAAVRAAEEAARKTQAGNESSAGKDYAPPSSFGGSTGERIAAYASQFVGNPYVAGGTSLTNGADCSGFIWRVFRDFGLSSPRTSWEFRSAGTGVEYSEAKPGDIICYAGHVGIFVGGGRIVHASTERTGIIFSSATYRPILAVRRLV